MIPSVLGMSNVSVADSGASVTENVKKAQHPAGEGPQTFFWWI